MSTVPKGCVECFKAKTPPPSEGSGVAPKLTKSAFKVATGRVAVKGRCPGPLDDGDGRPHLARPQPAIHGNAQENYLPASFAAAASFASFRPFPKTHAPSTPSS